MAKKRVAVDFDGVLHTYSKWNGPVPTGAPTPGSQDFIADLMGAGYEPVILSSRASSPEGAEGIRSWLSRWSFPAIRITSSKVAAIAYVDDRAVPYTGEFASCLEAIRSLEPGGGEALFVRSGTDPRTCSNCRAWMMVDPPASRPEDLQAFGKCATLSQAGYRSTEEPPVAGSHTDFYSKGSFYCNEHERDERG